MAQFQIKNSNKECVKKERGHWRLVSIEIPPKNYRPAEIAWVQQYTWLHHTCTRWGRIPPRKHPAGPQSVCRERAGRGGRSSAPAAPETGRCLWVPGCSCWQEQDPWSWTPNTWVSCPGGFQQKRTEEKKQLWCEDLLLEATLQTESHNTCGHAAVLCNFQAKSNVSKHSLGGKV